MIHKHNVIDYINNSDDLYYDDEKDLVIRKSDNVSVAMETFLDTYRRENGESFNCIYDFHVGLMEILECTECGTVIKYYCDESDEPDFKCPICTGYKTHFKYWTKEEINNNPELQEMVEFYRNMAIFEDEYYEQKQALEKVKK